TVTVFDHTATVTISGNAVDFPYFDHLILSPAPKVYGRININTASVNALQGLPGITSTLATNIKDYIDGPDNILWTGDDELIDTKGKLLKVTGIDEDEFKKICNLVTTRSDVFKVIVKAQAIKDRGSIGGDILASDDNITAQCTLEAIVDRSDYPNVKVLYLRYREE
ncbi:MAG: helix-hairpin-helix domain-containing protein, partial [Candidatus Theseobacter exili]|nr:helix-hairpin-helix domain-containing protein [Candidatus Theseobacter exili]